MNSRGLSALAEASFPSSPEEDRSRGHFAMVVYIRVKILNRDLNKEETS
jgi:hypothetical protein